MKTIKVSLILFLLISLISCQESGINIPEIDDTIPEDFTDYFGLLIQRDFVGQIVDASNDPIAGVNVSIHTKSTTTDDNGVFLLKDVTVRERFAYVKASKHGYINGSRTLMPVEGTNKVSIMMLSSTTTHITNSGTTETFSLSDGSSITLKGEYVDSQGSLYSGAAKVIFYHMTPSESSMIYKMPGTLYGEDIDGTENILESYGIIAIELRGDNGEELYIASGSSADILMPVEVDLINIAPSTIPLWFFDKEAGYWKEEGQATLQGNTYVSSINRLSFWNIAIKHPALRLYMNVTNQNGNVIANRKITLKQANTDYPYPITTGYTNAEGKMCGFMTYNEDIELDALCISDSFYNLSIDPVTIDTEIDLIFPQDTGMLFETVSGNFTQCDGETLTNGYVQFLDVENNFFEIIENGVFDINLLRCDIGTYFYINGNDYENSQTTDYLFFTYTTPFTDIGTIATCEDLK